MSLNDHLSRTYVAISLKRPTGKQIGQIYRFPTLARRLGLASDGVYTALHVTMQTVVSYTAFSPLPSKMAVIFCCTGLGVASTGRYPASCPMKPGLSSPALSSRDHLSRSRLYQNIKVFFVISDCCVPRAPLSNLTLVIRSFFS